MRTALIVIVLAAASTAAFAQTQQQDEERLRREGVERADAAARAQGFEQQRQMQERERQAEERRRSESNTTTSGGYTPSPSGGSSAGTGAAKNDFRAVGQKLLRTPPLPDERNVLLGRWRLEGGGPQSGIAEFGLTGRGATPGFGEMKEFFSSIESGKLACDMSFGSGITFAPTTFSSGGAAGMVGGPVAYRSGANKKFIIAIPADKRANPMFFDVSNPNRIVNVNAGDCALVRVGSPAANAAANATTARGNARTAAASPSAPPAAGMGPQVAAAANATNAKLAVGPDAGGYLCPDGRQLYVKSCYDESSESRCGVVNMHLPPRSDFQVVTTEIRSEVLSRVAACKILPLQFMNGTVSLVLPKSAPP